MVITPIVGVSILILRFPFASKNEMTISQIATFDFGTIMKSSKFFFFAKKTWKEHIFVERVIWRSRISWNINKLSQVSS